MQIKIACCLHRPRSMQEKRRGQLHPEACRPPAPLRAFRGGLQESRGPKEFINLNHVDLDSFSRSTFWHSGQHQGQLPNRYEVLFLYPYCQRPYLSLPRPTSPSLPPPCLPLPPPSLLSPASLPPSLPLPLWHSPLALALERFLHFSLSPKWNGVVHLKTNAIGRTWGGPHPHTTVVIPDKALNGENSENKANPDTHWLPSLPSHTHANATYTIRLKF